MQNDTPKKKKKHPLASWRKRNKKTQCELADDPQIRCQQSQISKIENGASHPRPKLLKKLMKRTGLSADAFFNYKSYPVGTTQEATIENADT